MRRRRLLTQAAGLGSVVIAGCLGTDEYVTLEGITLVNILDDEVAMELRIEKEDGTSIYENEYVLPAGFDGKSVDCVWPDEPLVVKSRRNDEDEWATYSTSDRETGCASLLVEVNQHGTSFYSGVHECPHPTRNCHHERG